MVTRTKRTPKRLRDIHYAAYGEYRKVPHYNLRHKPNEWAIFDDVDLEYVLPGNPTCPLCGYRKTIKNGRNKIGVQRYKCKSCEKVFLQPLGQKEQKKPKTAKEKPVITKTLNELKLVKEVKDLKAEVIRKNVQISNLKNKIKKLNGQLISPEQDKKRKRQIYIENPEFLEIT